MLIKPSDRLGVDLRGSMPLDNGARSQLEADLERSWAFPSHRACETKGAKEVQPKSAIVN
jgi:hypothetical protein